LPTTLVLYTGCDVGRKAAVENFDCSPELFRHDQLILT
jgi:hypothetical protein